MGIGALAGRDLSARPAKELEAHLIVLERQSRILEAERLRCIAELDRRRKSAADGHLSTATWMADRLGVSFAAATQQVRTARAVEEMPSARQALGSGELSASAVRVLVEAKQEQPEAFAESESLLVQAARNLSVRQLQSTVVHWSQNVDERAAEERAKRLRERRQFRIAPCLSGMVRVDGELDPETGQTVLTALRSIMDRESRSRSGDARSADQRRADALGEICWQWLGRGDRPTVAGERPHVVVTVGLDDLRAGRGTAELDEAGPVDVGAARRLACDASVTRVVLSSRSEPLDVGRRTPVVPAALRRAVVVRDRRCRFPGCDRPAPWCDAHHVRHWADGGETKLANLVLLCRPHHGIAHNGVRVEMIQGSPVFVKGDGSRLEDRGPP
jgi:hypothetical protein